MTLVCVDELKWRHAHLKMRDKEVLSGETPSLSHRLFGLRSSGMALEEM